MEHPFYGSWGYQTTGYFAPTSRYGTPQDFMYLIDTLHQHGIGVILDWVPSHFPTDEHGLGYFDGTHLYEHADPRQGFHPDWNSFIFNYGRNEVRSFLHQQRAVLARQVPRRRPARRRRGLDALPRLLAQGGRVDSEPVRRPREPRGHRVPAPLQRARSTASIPDVQTIAEESTAWPMVSRPTYVGGLGFGFKWDMGWMHDTLQYMSHDPIHRKYHHNELTFRHDLRVHRELRAAAVARRGRARQGLAARQDARRRLAEVRQPAPAVRLHVHPAGQEAAVHGRRDRPVARVEPRRAASTGTCSSTTPHHGLQRWVRDLNTCYRGEPALHELRLRPRRLRVDRLQRRRAERPHLPAPRQDDRRTPWSSRCNFTPVPRHNYRIGVPRGGYWEEMLNSDAPLYGGSGQGNLGGVTAAPVAWHGQAYSLNITLPPLGMVVFKSPAVG